MARILRQPTVVRDGMHNAFTDLIFWQGCYWISYRKGESHISMDSEAALSVSVDRERFREVAHLKVPGDNRDPKLIQTNDGRLAMYFPSWLGGHSQWHLQQFISFSEDGFNWSQPEPIYKPHWWLWRIVNHNGRYYSAAYSYADESGQKCKSRRVHFLASDDLRQWEVLSPLDGVNGGETGIHFFENGQVWQVTRNADKIGPAFLSVSQPPYNSWETSALNYTIHSPVILEHNAQLFVAGRRNALQDEPCFAYRGGRNEDDCAWSLGIWRLEKGTAQPVLNIPACGDCAYPGFIKDPEGRICMSYYSEHAYRSGVLSEKYSATGERLVQNDIYFAELDLS